MSPHLALSGTFTQPDLDFLCDELRDLPKWPAGEPARVDLRKLQSMEPTPLAVLLASLSRLHKREICNPLQHLEPPQAGEGIECLEPGRLHELLAGGSGHWQQIDNGDPTILGCECFAGFDGVDSVTRGLYKKLAVHTDWPSASLKAVGSMIFELSENVIQHSQTAGGVAVLQIRPAEERIALAIADSGVGIRRSLARNPEFRNMRDDLAAISKAMGPRTSGEPGTGGGMGLFLARCLVRSNGGSFMVRSGEACRQESEALKDLGQLPYLHGTLVSVEARTDLSFEYDEAVSTSLRQADSTAASQVGPAT